MYKLFIANKNYSSWSLRPWVLMKTLGLAFEEVLLPFQAAQAPQFGAVSPTGRMPCLQDGQRLVWDSLAITEYLAERHADVWPQDEDARAFARCAAAEMHSSFAALRNHCGMNCAVRVTLREVPTSVQAEVTGYDLTKHALTYPPGSKITFEFPARQGRAPVTLVWHAPFTKSGAVPGFFKSAAPPCDR